MQHTVQHHEHWSVGVKLLVERQSDVSMFDDVSVILNKKTLSSGGGEHPIAWPVMFERICGTPVANDSGCNTYWNWRFPLVAHVA